MSFSQVAPANPIRGNFWWDGTTLWLFDGAAWVDTADGTSASSPVFIGATAPVSPSPGSLWWNGTLMQLWDGTKWNMVGPSGSMGVIDGSVAQPGHIGEYINGTSSSGYPAGIGNTPFSFTPLTVPPGAWLLWTKAELTTFVSGVEWNMSSLPTGMSAELAGIVGNAAGLVSAFTVIGTQSIANFSAATSLPVQGTVFQQITAQPAGVIYISIEAVRIR